VLLIAFSYLLRGWDQIEGYGVKLGCFFACIRGVVFGFLGVGVVIVNVFVWV